MNVDIAISYQGLTAWIQCIKRIRALVLVLNSKHIYSICLNLINSIATWHSKKLIHLMHWTNLFQCNEKYLHFHLPA